MRVLIGGVTVWWSRMRRSSRRLEEEGGTSMRRRSSLAMVLSVGLGSLVGLGAGCSSPHHAAKAAATPEGSNAVTLNSLSKVEPGMTMIVVVRAVGAPDGEKGNTYYYKNRGRIVFEGKGTPSDATKVLRVEKDVMEDGIP